MKFSKFVKYAFWNNLMAIRISSFFVKLSCKWFDYCLFAFDCQYVCPFSDKRSGVLCLIFELMNLNLYEYIRGRQRLLSSEIVCKFMYQLIKALEFLHRYFIVTTFHKRNFVLSFSISRHTFFHRDVILTRLQFETILREHLYASRSNQRIFSSKMIFWS